MSFDGQTCLLRMQAARYCVMVGRVEVSEFQNRTDRFARMGPPYAAYREEEGAKNSREAQRGSSDPIRRALPSELSTTIVQLYVRTVLSLQVIIIKFTQ